MKAGPDIRVGGGSLDAGPVYAIRPNARPGDGLRIRLLRALGGARAPRTAPCFTALIYKAERLGDFFLAIETIRRLTAHWQGARIGLVTTAECAELAAAEFPDLPRIVVPLRLSGGGWNLAEAVAVRRTLAECSCEHLVSLSHHRQPLAAISLRWIPARYRWGTAGHPWMPSATTAAERGLFDRTVPYPWPPLIEVPDEVEAHAGVLRHVTGSEVESASLLPRIVPPEAPAASPTLTVVPWASSGIKSLPGEFVVAVLRHLADRTRFRVRIVADPRREAASQVLARELSGGMPGLDIASQPTPSLAALRGCLAGALAVLTADTFPAHLATALDRPTAVVATGAMPGVFGPWRHSERQRWFVREMTCWGCGWRCIHAQPLCLRQVEPRDVADFLLPYLSARQ